MRLTIYDIRRAVGEKGSCFFSKINMRFYNQTCEDFHVEKYSDNEYFIWANYRYGKTERWFYVDTKTLHLDRRGTENYSEYI
jgi:hypothetical protein